MRAAIEIRPFAGDRVDIDDLLGIWMTADGIDIPCGLDADNARAGIETAFVAVQGKELIGVACLPDDPRPEAWLIVHPGYRRRGAGRALLNALRAEAVRRGLTRFLLVNNGASDAGTAFLNAVGTRQDRSEYRLVLDRARIERPASLPGFRLRPARPDELDVIARIRAAAFEEDLDEARASVLRRVAEPDRRYFLGVLGETPIGVLRTGDWERGAEITSFGVLPDHQGRGYGRRMLIEAVDLLVREGYESVTIEVASDNDHALGLYRSCGFNVIARYDYYDIVP